MITIDYDCNRNQPHPWSERIMSVVCAVESILLVRGWKAHKP